MFILYIIITLGKSCNPLTSFACDNGICLPLSNKCDDYKECSDGSDELSCDQRHFTSCLDWWQAGYRVTGEYSIGKLFVKSDHCNNGLIDGWQVIE